MAGGGLRYFRCNPLRCSKMASMPFLSCKFFALQKTYEINVAGILPARLRRQTASLPFFAFRFLRSQKPGKSIHAGIHAGHPWRIKTLDFAAGKIHLSTEGG
jgi:hypothetical protein